MEFDPQRNHRPLIAAEDDMDMDVTAREEFFPLVELEPLEEEPDTAPDAQPVEAAS